MNHCKKYITSQSELSDLERETLSAKFRKHPNAKHKVVFCREDRTMVIAAAYGTPLTSTEKAITFMQNLYKPVMIEVVPMSRVVA